MGKMPSYIQYFFNHKIAGDFHLNAVSETIKL